MQTPSLNSHQIIDRMYEFAPPGSPLPQDPETWAALTELTADLVRAYSSSGQIQEDPFEEAWKRPLSLYEEVRDRLRDKVVLVTGGEGCVGQFLIEKLGELGVGRIVSVDFARIQDGAAAEAIAGVSPNLILYAADIRDKAAMVKIFETEHPQIVFHLAAERLPGLAEKKVRETVTSNVLGSRDLIALCETYGVEQCVFSSTGKASRYFTAEVYAGSKKMAEWLFTQANQTSKVRYSMVRFTHMLDNSAMREHIEAKVAAGGPLNIHSPNRYVVGQNVGEAAYLMLNGLVLSEEQRTTFLLVRNLGWPVESLEYALYQIRQSGKPVAIYFEGVQPGYEESFFLGQADWDDQMEINTLINALETSYHSIVSSSNDMVVAETYPFSMEVLNQQMEILERVSHDPDASEPMIKQTLAAAVRAIALTSFQLAPVERVLQILRWGVNPKQVKQGLQKLEPHLDIITLVVKGLEGRLTPEILANSCFSLPEFAEVVAVLATLPSLQSEVAFLRSVVDAAGDSVAGTIA